MLMISLGVAAVGAYLIYRLVKMSLTTGRKDGFVMASLIGLVILLGVTALLNGAGLAKPKTTPTVAKSSKTNTSEPSRPTSSSTDTQVRSRIKAYMDRLPGSMIVIVRGDSAGIIVETDYNFGTGDKETAKSLATNLIYQIMNDNSDCTFKYISVNCMDGKNPVGAIVNYENGSFSTLP